MAFNIKVRSMRGRNPKMGKVVHLQGLGLDTWKTRCGISFLDADPTSEPVTCKNCIRIDTGKTMPNIRFTPEEIQEAIRAIPDGWGWHTLAMVNSDPTMGHKVHHSHAVTLVKAGVIGWVPNSGDPQDGRLGPWYAVTKLGELVAEAVGLWLTVGIPSGVVIQEVKPSQPIDPVPSGYLHQECPDCAGVMMGSMDSSVCTNPDCKAVIMDEEHKEQFRAGWECGAEDISQGKDQTEYGSPEDGPVWSDWFYCGYNSAHNRWNGTVGKYTRLGSELGCEVPKGPKEG